MQSKYIVLPCWPDKDAVKCIVDLRCRIVGGLDRPVERGVGLNHYKTANKMAWAQIQADLIEDTAEQQPAGPNRRRLSIPDQFPKVLGVVMNSKDPYFALRDKPLECCNSCLAQYKIMVEKLSDVGKDPRDGRRLIGVASEGAITVLRHEGGNLRRHDIHDYPALQMGDVRFEMYHGGKNKPL